MRDYSPLYLSAHVATTRDLAAKAVAAYRQVNTEAYRKLEALAQLEALCDEFGSIWVADRAAEISTARRVKGLK